VRETSIAKLNWKILECTKSQVPSMLYNSTKSAGQSVDTAHDKWLQQYVAYRKLLTQQGQTSLCLAACGSRSIVLWVFVTSVLLCHTLHFSSHLAIPVQHLNPDWGNSVNKNPISWSNAGRQLHRLLLGNLKFAKSLKNSSSVTEFEGTLTLSQTYLQLLTFIHLVSNTRICPRNFAAGAWAFSALYSP
jgi:hypothetical protein